MLSSRLITALVLLVFGGPVLVFPDLLPATWRTGVVTVITLAAVGLALVLMQPWTRFRWGLWLFLMAVVASWAAMPVHDLLGLRHFAGIGVGVLAMAVVATWCTTTERLMTATLLFAVASIGILSLGLVGAHLANTKLVIDATQPFPPPSNIYTPEAYLYPWLPNLISSWDYPVWREAMGGSIRTHSAGLH